MVTIRADESENVLRALEDVVDHVKAAADAGDAISKGRSGNDCCTKEKLASINSHMHFRKGKDGKSVPFEDRQSIFKTLDALIRNQVQSDEFTLRVVKKDRSLYVLDHRRLTALKMKQALQQDETVWVNCIVRPPNPEFASKYSTESDGLRIIPQGGMTSESLHLGAPVFNQACQAQVAIRRLSDKHPTLKLNAELMKRLVGMIGT